MRIRPLIPDGPALLVTACACALLLAAAPAATAAPAKARGTLVVAVDAATAPYAFSEPDGSRVLGLDADLSQALANVLGYRFRIVDVPSDRIIPGLVSGEYDLGMSFTDTRAQEKLVDFITYLAPGTSFYVNAAATLAIRKPADLCGRSVAVVRGTAQAAAATAQSAGCKAAGKPAVRIAVFRDADAARLALSSGRVQVGMADSAVVAYAMRQMHGKFKLAGPASDGEPRSIAVARENDMAEQVRDALATVMGDGTYDAILARWGAQAGAIATPRINVAAG